MHQRRGATWPAGGRGGPWTPPATRPRVLRRPGDSPTSTRLRGLAALWVFLLHIHGYWLDNVRPPTLTADGLLVRVMGFGGAGVDIFIVLSGFCLTLPLLRGGSMRSLDARRFFRRRAYRLLPAYYAAVVLVMALELVPALQERLVATTAHAASTSSPT